MDKDWIEVPLLSAFLLQSRVFGDQEGVRSARPARRGGQGGEGEHREEPVVEPAGKETSSSSSSQKPNGPTSQEDKNISPWVYVSEGTQLTVTLLLGFYIGYKLDQKKGTLPWFTLAGSALGLVLGLYSFLKRFLKK